MCGFYFITIFFMANSDWPSRHLDAQISLWFAAEQARQRAEKPAGESKAVSDAQKDAGGHAMEVLSK